MTGMRIISSVFITALFFLAAPAQAEFASALRHSGQMTGPGAALSAGSDLGSELRWAVREHVLATRGVGISVAIASGGEITFQYAFGYADLEHLAPAKPETVYRLASISKPVTAVAVMQLVDKGLLDLDEDCRKYVPEFPEKQYVFTTRQVLSHLSGIRHYSGLEIRSKRAYSSVDDSLSIFKDDPLLFKPGERSSYSTYAFTLLAKLVENVSHSTFPEYLKANIFEPAGMEKSATEDLRAIVPNRARGYIRTRGDTLMNSEYSDISYKWGGGGMVSTAVDLCRFGSSLTAGRLLSEDARGEMWTRQRTNDGEELTYGLGWGVGSFLDRRTVSHGGAQQATRTFLLVFPDDDVVVAVMSNYENDQPSRLARRLAEMWFAGQVRSVSASPRALFARG